MLFRFFISFFNIIRKLTNGVNMVICGESSNVKTAPRQMYKNSTAESCLGWDEIPASLKPTLDTLKTKNRNKKIRQLTTLLPNQSLKKGLILWDFLTRYHITTGPGRTNFGICWASDTVATIRKIQMFLFLLVISIPIIFGIQDDFWGILDFNKQLTVSSFAGWFIPSVLLMMLAVNLEFFPKKNREAFNAVEKFQSKMREFFECFPTLSKTFFKCQSEDEISFLIDNHLVRIATELMESEIANFSFDSPKTEKIRERFNQKFEIADALGMVKPKKLYFLMAQDNIKRYQSFNPNI